ncbi:D-alanyl-D-alanine carboxypeptidase family protein [Streptomyces sp. NPDC059943]|uniref:D-alanyl-D-alanine carboxypeptidase family protein n=1 Tax=Streptomyces sp. NPDC059943 TaxID=3347010 RepID=UPI0036687D6F
MNFRRSAESRSETASTGPEGAPAAAKPGTAPSASRSDAAPARTDSGRQSGGHGAAAGAEPETTPEAGVDRKTAVFKALKRPGVDQPTAMLKLPPQPPAPAPELPAERTSKFVPLRSDQAQPAAPAPAAGSATGVAEAERTRQQPMPPLPPLDLLAELTNKPAPPETPTRTVVRRVKIWTPLLVLVLIIFAVVQAVRPLPAPSLNLTAKSTYTFEGDKPALPWPGEGQGFMAATGLGTVDSFGEQKAVPIGSVAKAMTAYVVLKDKPLAKGAEGPSITVDAKAEEDGGLDAQGESTLNTVKEGDKLTQHDALAALMIPSANNIARLLARWNADGSEEAFVKKMNDTAEELGMKNTTYTDPSGLDATTVSSAEDQVKLGQKLVEIEALMDITKLPEWKDPSGKTWRNYNTLVPYDGALGIKTGSTTKAGGNLLFAAHKTVGDTDQLIVGAVLGQHRAPIIDTVNAVSKDVMLATQDELEGATIVKKGQVVGEFDNGMGTTAPVVATEDVKAVGWSGLTVKLELSDEGEKLPQSAAAGTHVGLLTVGEGKSRVEVAVALQGDLAEPTFGDKLTRVG